MGALNGSMRKRSLPPWKRPFVPPHPDMAAMLKQAREAAGLSQDQLARAAGITQPFVCNLEHGRYSPSPRTVGRIREILGVTLPLPLVDVSQTAAGREAARRQALQAAAALARRAAIPRFEPYYPPHLQRWT